MAPYHYTISYGDTDAGGVVYFANYLRLCERSWFRFLKERGWDLAVRERDGALFLTVKKVEADFIAPARYGTTVEIVTTVENLTRASLWFRHVLRDAETQTQFATVRNQMVAVDGAGKLRRLPPTLREILAEALGKENEGENGPPGTGK